MNFDFAWMLAALGGGFIGAALGAIPAFVLTGLVVLIGVIALMIDPSSTWLSAAAFGPLLGPHVAFAGGVAATAYAGKKGLLSGRSVTSPLVALNRIDVLLVGAAFGAGGYFVQLLVATIPWFGSHTDSVALTAVLSGVVARFAFGSTGIFGKVPQGSGWSRFAPTADANWIRSQEKLVDNVGLGLFAGLFASGLALFVGQGNAAVAPYAHVLGFGLSAVSLLFLCAGLSFPVTHHITIIAGLGAATFLPIVGSTWVALLIGGAFGVIAALAAELFARLFLDHADTHIDPPAFAIWPCTTLVLGLAALINTVNPGAGISG